MSENIQSLDFFEDETKKRGFVYLCLIMERLEIKVSEILKIGTEKELIDFIERKLEAVCKECYASLKKS